MDPDKIETDDNGAVVRPSDPYDPAWIAWYAAHPNERRSLGAAAVEVGDGGEDDGKPDSIGDEITELYDQLADDAGDQDGAGKSDDDEGSADGETHEQEAADAEGDEDDGDHDGAEVVAPEHWSDQDKEAFAALPDEAKPLYLEKVKAIESGYNAKFEELAEDRKKIAPYQAFDEIFAPYRHELDRQGLTPEGYVRQIMAVAKSLQENPAAELTRLASIYGVDFGQAQAEQAGDDEFLDPVAAARIQQLEALIQTKLPELESSLNQVTQASTTASQRQYLDTFNAFAQEHEHAERLRPQIAAQLQVMTPADEQGKTLNELISLAYERAAWADPDARASLLAAEQKAKAGNGQGNGQMKAQVQKAKKAGRVVHSKSDSASKMPEARSEAGSWREGVAAAMAELEAS